MWVGGCSCRVCFAGFQTWIFSSLQWPCCNGNNREMWSELRVIWGYDCVEILCCCLLYVMYVCMHVFGLLEMH